MKQKIPTIWFAIPRQMDSMNLYSQMHMHKWVAGREQLYLVHNRTKE